MRNVYIFGFGFTIKTKTNIAIFPLSILKKTHMRV